MKLENQVVSLELAKRLKELGVKQESLFVWADNPRKDLAIFLSDAFGLGDERYSAFTVAELGEMIPNHYQTWKNSNNQFVCTVPAHDDDCYEQQASAEAEARAKMLCYLLENKLITL